MDYETQKHIKPTDIRLHQKSKVLEITFEDGAHFHLPCEYLRVYSPSAEVQGHAPGEEVLQVAKESVNIKDIEAVGHYAVILHFDDDHNTGIYSWQHLYRLGAQQETLWQSYLDRLEAAGHTRKTQTVQ